MHRGVVDGRANLMSLDSSLRIIIREQIARHGRQQMHMHGSMDRETRFPLHLHRTAYNYRDLAVGIRLPSLYIHPFRSMKMQLGLVREVLAL